MAVISRFVCLVGFFRSNIASRNYRSVTERCHFFVTRSSPAFGGGLPLSRGLSRSKRRASATSAHLRHSIRKFCTRSCKALFLAEKFKLIVKRSKVSLNRQWLLRRYETCSSRAWPIRSEGGSVIESRSEGVEHERRRDWRGE